MCVIEVSRTDKFKAAVRVESQCGQVSKLAEEIPEVDFLDIMRGGFGQNQIFLSATRCKLHSSCPAPSALIKAVEAELGMAVKKDVSVSFAGD